MIYIYINMEEERIYKTPLYTRNAIKRYNENQKLKRQEMKLNGEKYKWKITDAGKASMKRYYQKNKHLIKIKNKQKSLLKDTLYELILKTQIIQ